MGRVNRDVGGYRGRRTITDILRFIAAALAVVVVLVVAGVFYLQRYVVYTDEGAKLELPPFLELFRQEKTDPPGPGSASLPDPGDVSVVIQPVGDESEPPPEEQPSPGLALQLSMTEVVNGTAAARLEEAGAEALILEMKGQDGKLAWRSSHPAAERAEINAPQSANDALEQWNAGEGYTIARVCCFRDDTAPYFRNKLALRRGEYNWRDELGLRWLSPAHEEAQSYVADLCGELAALGFDEIVLEHFYFPIRGNVENINRGDNYNPAQFGAELEEFLTLVQQAVEPYGTKISLRFESAALNEGAALSGVTSDLLNRYAYRFWTDQEGWMTLSASPDVSDITERTVELVSQATEDRERFQAILPET